MQAMIDGTPMTILINGSWYVMIHVYRSKVW